MKFLIGVVITIVLLIFIIIKLLTGGSGSKAPAPLNLASYASTATTVRYTIDGPVSAPQTHNDIIIEVGSSSTDIKITKGYDGEVIKEQSFPMTESAYSTFLLALQKSAGYNLGNSNKKFQDQRGACATGNRFIYEVISGEGDTLQHFWSTSCKDKTFKGLPDVVRQLFEAQVPNYNDFTESVSLY